MIIPSSVKNYTIKELQDIFLSLDGIKLALLFGSRAKKTEHILSDYDIALWSNAKDAWEFGKYYPKTLELLDIPERALDIINLEEAQGFLLENILEKYIILKGSEDELRELLSTK
jgi:predicted nucleotidyltransferase